MPGREACVAGVDVGTTGARAVAFTLRGDQVHAVSRDYPLESPRPGWAEQDPRRVASAATECLRELAQWAREHGYAVRAVGLSAILHSIIPIDAAGEPLGPSIIWADTRSAAEADEIKRETDAIALYRRVGGPVHPMYSPPKLRWLRRHRRDVFDRASTFAGIKELLLHRWTGALVCDRSIASGTGMYNGVDGAWDLEALALAGIDARRLPPVIETTERIDVDPERLRALGLPDDCALVAGAGDGVLQTIGSGCVAPGQMVAMVATSGAIRAVVDRFTTDDRARTWCYYLAAGRWVAGAAINNAGIVYAWLRDQLQAAAHAAGAPGELDVTQLNDWAEQVPPGSNGLLFLPYLAGERSPNWNANARGLLFGLSLAHDYRHLARATLEGVAYRMRTIFEPMEEVTGPAREIRAAGGFIRSPLWLQIVSDVIGRRLSLVESSEASALGAAQLAMLGTGLVTRFEDLAPMVETSGAVEPAADRHALYSRLYSLYQRTYARLGSEFDAISALQSELTENAG